MPIASSAPGLESVQLASFAVMDVVRRAQGKALEAVGLGPSECEYRAVASGTHWRLREYSSNETAPSALVVAAPIKRPYIWDLCPAASALRLMLAHVHVYLLEWLPPSAREENVGVDEYVRAVSECVRAISDATSRGKPFMVGHSLGGTLAAVFASWAPDYVRGLVLLGAPLCFEPGSSRFRDAIVSLVPPEWSDAGWLPGSFLSYVSAGACPEAFIGSRLIDAVLSSADPRALELHARVERWALDEVAVPARLVRQIVDRLYRGDGLCRGTLRIEGTTVGPHGLSVPTLAVVNRWDEIAPLSSVEAFVRNMPNPDVRVIEYPGEVGIGLEHLGILIGRQAHRRVWPEILAWLGRH